MMLSGARRALIVTGVLLAAACLNLESPAPTNQSQLVVQSVLDPDASVDAILVYRARTGADSTSTISGSHDQPVTGAVVTVTGPDGKIMSAVQAAPDSSFAFGPGGYGFNPFSFGTAIRPGGTYTLHVRTPSGEEVSGTTTVPRRSGRVSISPTAPVFLRLRDTLRLTWVPAGDARSYELIIRPEDTAGGYRIFTGTSVAVPGAALTVAGDEVFPSGDNVDVVVSATDTNYYEYYRAQSDPLAGTAPSHLVGAVGVFGSVTAVLRFSVRVR